MADKLQPLTVFNVYCFSQKWHLPPFFFSNLPLDRFKVCRVESAMSCIHAYSFNYPVVHVAAHVVFIQGNHNRVLAKATNQTITTKQRTHEFLTKMAQLTKSIIQGIMIMIKQISLM